MFSKYPDSINNRLQDVNTDYNSFIIKPPDKNLTSGRMTKTFVIDSRDRDINIYPNSNKYRVLVPEEWRDIVSSELVYGEIPNTYYNVNEDNNIIYLSEEPYNLLSVTIPVGMYSNDDLIDILNGKMGNLFINFTSKFNFTITKYSKKLRISNNNATNNAFIFNINYSKECQNSCKYVNMDYLLGFTNKEYTSDIISLSTYNVTSITDLGTTSINNYSLRQIVISNIDIRSELMVGDYIIINNGTNEYEVRIYEILNDTTMNVESIDNLDPSGSTGYILEDINVLFSPNIVNINIMPYIIIRLKSDMNFNLLYSNSDNSADSSYAIVSLLKDKKTIINNSTIQYGGVIKYFNPPIPRMVWIDVEFLNYDGTLFNFRGMDNMLVLNLTILNQPGKYNP